MRGLFLVSPKAAAEFVRPSIASLSSTATFFQNVKNSTVSHQLLKIFIYFVSLPLWISCPFTVQKFANNIVVAVQNFVFVISVGWWKEVL